MASARSGARRGHGGRLPRSWATLASSEPGGYGPAGRRDGQAGGQGGELEQRGGEHAGPLARAASTPQAHHYLAPAAAMPCKLKAILLRMRLPQ